MTLDLLKQLTDEFLHIFDKCPTRLKRLKTLNNSTQQAAEEQRKAKEEEQAAAGASSSSSSSSNQRHHGHSSSSSKIPPLGKMQKVSVFLHRELNDYYCRSSKIIIIIAWFVKQFVANATTAPQNGPSIFRNVTQFIVSYVLR